MANRLPVISTLCLHTVLTSEEFFHEYAIPMAIVIDLAGRN